MSEFGFVFAVVFVLWLLTGLRIVRQQNVAIVEVLGKYQKTMSAGLNWIIPAPFGRIAYTLTLRICELKAPVEIKTVDNVFVVMPMVLMIRVIDGSEQEAYYKLANPEEQIKKWVLNTVRSTVNKMTLDELFSDRTNIESSVHGAMQGQLAEYGYELVNLLVEQPSVSNELQIASNRVVASEREKEAAAREGEAARIKIVAAAKAESEGQIERAKGIAEARKIIARAYAESLADIKTQAPDANATQIMELLIATNRLDAMRDVGRHGNLVLMDCSSPQVALEGVLTKKLSSKADT